MNEHLKEMEDCIIKYIKFICMNIFFVFIDIVIDGASTRNIALDLVFLTIFTVLVIVAVNMSRKRYKQHIKTLLESEK